jgi:hypothetical protein
MMIDRSPQPPRHEFYAARARRARGWAFLTGLGLVGCVLVAIWQEPELSPALHEKLAQAVAKSETMIAHNERIQTFLTRWSSAAQSATGERTDPVTALLEKIKD